MEIKLPTRGALFNIHEIEIRESVFRVSKIEYGSELGSVKTISSR